MGDEFINGFGYPLVLKSLFSWFVWFSRCFLQPIDPGILFFLVFLILSMVFAIPYNISAVRFLRFPRGCLTECSLHAHGMSFGMSNGMLLGCLTGCQNGMNPECSQPDASSPMWQCVLSKLMLHELLHVWAKQLEAQTPAAVCPKTSSSSSSLLTPFAVRLTPELPLDDFGPLIPGPWSSSRAFDSQFWKIQNKVSK